MSGGFSNNGPKGGSQLTSPEVLWVQTGNTGVLLLTEQASAPSTTPNVGKIYVKSSDSRLYYKDDSGNEFQIGTTSSGILTVETPVGTVNGSNTSFTVSHSPLFVVIDRAFCVPDFGYTYSDPTISVDPLAPPVSFIRSYYIS